MKRRNGVFVSLMILLFVTGTAYAASSYAWRDHATPFDFLFGNHIDTHQQTKKAGENNLNGFFYITYTGETTPDGVPIAMHGDCTMHPENCTVGWLLKGISTSAVLLEKEQGQHPLWCLNPTDVPSQKGFSHFHWLGSPEHAGDLEVGQTYDGFLLKLTARELFFFDHHGGFLITPGIDDLSHANIETDCDFD